MFMLSYSSILVFISFFWVFLTLLRFLLIVGCIVSSYSSIRSLLALLVCLLLLVVASTCYPF